MDDRDTGRTIGDSGKARGCAAAEALSEGGGGAGDEGGDAPARQAAVGAKGSGCVLEFSAWIVPLVTEPKGIAGMLL